MPAKKKGRNIHDFKSATDPHVMYTDRVKAGLASLLKEGPEAWEYEQEFRLRCGVPPQYFSAYHGLIKPNVVEIPGKSNKNGNPKIVIFATAKAAAKARG